MSQKYIRKNKNSFNIVKSSKTYGKFDSLDDAVLIRDELIKNNWDMDSVDEMYKIDGKYLVFKVIEGKIHLILKSDEKPSKESVDELVKKKIRNPNNSKYGLNILKLFDTFIIKKQIAGDEYVFGYYDKLEDAQFVRNFLMDNNWNVNAFSQIEFDEDTDTYKVIEVIDDKAYVLKTFKGEIDLEEVHSEFLTKITKHKLGLAQYPHLDELKNQVPDLEERFNVNASDDMWSFKDTSNPLEDVIFFQQSVYDAVDNSSFEDIKKSLIRYKSGNFDSKIKKNLDELIERGLIFENKGVYKKL